MPEEIQEVTEQENLATSSDDTSDTPPPEPEVQEASGAEDGGDAAAADAGGEAPAAEGEVEAEESAWSPDAAKFKVDGKELDYDDNIKSFLTKENEPVIRELVERAHGIDVIKTRHEEVKSERDQLRGHLQGVANEVKEVMDYARAGDFHSFLNACNIPFDEMAKWFYQELKRQEELPEEHRGMYHQNRQIQGRVREADKEMAAMRAQTTDALAQVQGMQLDTALANPQFKEIADAFDSANGNGSFRQSVIEWAAAREHATQRQLSVKDAVEGYCKVIGRAPTAGKPAAAAPKTKPQVVAAHRPATIPKVSGAAASPMGRKPKSLDELRQMAKTGA